MATTVTTRPGCTATSRGCSKNWTPSAGMPATAQNRTPSPRSPQCFSSARPAEPMSPTTAWPGRPRNCSASPGARLISPPRYDTPDQQFEQGADRSAATRAGPAGRRRAPEAGRHRSCRGVRGSNRAGGQPVRRSPCPPDRRAAAGPGKRVRGPGRAPGGSRRAQGDGGHRRRRPVGSQRAASRPSPGSSSRGHRQRRPPPGHPARRPGGARPGCRRLRGLRPRPGGRGNSWTR